MWRIIIVLTLSLFAVACGSAPASPADEPEQIEAVDAAVEALAAQLGLEKEDIKLLKVEDAEWTDSCLGLGGPAESCLQVITPGYRVTLEAGGMLYLLRTDTTGSQVRLDIMSQ